MRKNKLTQKINFDPVRPDKSLTPDELTDADLEVVVGGLDDPIYLKFHGVFKAYTTISSRSTGWMRGRQGLF